MRPDLTAVLAADGPFVSVYLTSTSSEENAADQLELRWKNVRRSLEDEGADDETLAAIDEVVVGERGGLERQIGGPVGQVGADVHTGNTRGEADSVLPGRRENRGRHEGGDTLAIVAGGGRVLLVDGLPGRPTAELDRYRIGLLPWLTPLLEAERARLPFVVVRLDRSGADITSHGPAGDEVDASVEGPDGVIVRSRAGEGSQGGSRRAIDSWTKNAAEVAHEVAELGDRVHAVAVLVGGDVAAVPLFEEAVPERVKPLVRRLEHTNRADGGDDELAEREIAAVMAEIAEADHQASLAEWQEERGQHDRAAETHGRVVEALQMQIVQTLFVHDDPEDERMAWFGPEPGLLGLQRSDLESMGVASPDEARLVDVCIRAALGTGADVRVVSPDELADGFGAVLRTGGVLPPAPTAEGE